MGPQSSIGLGKRFEKILGNLCRNMATFFFSPSEVRCLPTPSTIKPEEREIVVDSSTSIYMLSKKDLNAAELETVRVSRNPTKIITANCEVQTIQEAVVNVKDLNQFVTVQLLEDRPPVLSLGQLCQDHGYSFEWTARRKTSYQTWKKDTMQHGELRSCCRSRSVEWNFQFQSGTPVSYLFIRGIIARKFHAETSKMRNQARTKLST